MIVYQASLQMSLNAVVGPDAGTNGGFASGGLSLGTSIVEQFTAVTRVIPVRMLFGASGATGQIDLDPTAGTAVLPATAGARQVETATVTAAAGATASGNLVVTLTGAAISGSPVAINVPLVTGTHTTAPLIASAIASTLNAHAASAFPTYYTAAASGATVVITAIYPAANDGTLNLAIAAGLGVTAAASSANTTAGVAGSILDMPTADAIEPAAGYLDAFTNIDAVLLRVGANSPTEVFGISDGGAMPLPIVKPGKAMLWQADAFEPLLSFQSGGLAVADLLLFGH